MNLDTVRVKNKRRAERKTILEVATQVDERRKLWKEVEVAETKFI